MPNFGARVQDAVFTPGRSTDLFLGTLLTIAGLWLAHSDWLRWLYPSISSEMAAWAPIWSWALALILLGAAMCGATVANLKSLLVVAHMASFGLLGMLAFLFVWGRVAPPMIGPLFAVIAVFGHGPRLLQIPR